MGGGGGWCQKSHKNKGVFHEQPLKCLLWCKKIIKVTPYLQKLTYHDQVFLILKNFKCVKTLTWTHGAHGQIPLHFTFLSIFAELYFCHWISRAMWASREKFPLCNINSSRMQKHLRINFMTVIKQARVWDLKCCENRKLTRIKWKMRFLLEKLQDVNINISWEIARDLRNSINLTIYV